MKKSLWYFILGLFICLVQVNLVFAYQDGDNPLEDNKNFRFGANDIDSPLVNMLYFSDDTQLPERFSLKDQMSIVVGDQGSYGLCDSFATIESIETNYALKNGVYIDLSERYLDYMTSNSFYDIMGSRASGSAIFGPDGLLIAMTFGVPTEEEIPYRVYEEDEYDLIRNAHNVVRATSSVLFPNVNAIEDSELKARWIEVIKSHVMKYGSIRSSYYGPQYYCSFYNRVTKSAFYKNSFNQCNDNNGHAVSIVGWDDNYPKENFSTLPENNGAFIVLNSWGDSWGDEGYFYVSYEDEVLLHEIYGVLNTVAATTYNDYSYVSKLTGSSMGFNVNVGSFAGISFERKSENEYFSHVTVGAGEDNKSGLLSNKTRIYLNPIDGSFDKDKLILIAETNVQTMSKRTTFSLDNPIKITGDEFAIVFELVGNESDLMYSIIWDTSAKSGKLFFSRNLSGNWTSASLEVPVYAFTINAKSGVEFIQSSEYTIDKNYIIAEINQKTSTNYLNDITLKSGVSAKVLNGYKPLKDGYVGTGMTLRLNKDSDIAEYNIVVKGDVNGDGEADFFDITDLISSVYDYPEGYSWDESVKKAININDNSNPDFFSIISLISFIYS